MTSAPTKFVPPIDPALLARLTGALGDKQTIAKLCADFGQLYSEFLPDIFQSETGLTMEVAYGGHETGLMSDLIADLGDNFVLADTSLRNWAPHFTLACGNSFVITLMENLLGAMPETIEEPIELARAVVTQSTPDTLVVVDCLTLWLTNLLMPMHGPAAHAAEATSELLDALRDARGPVVLVGNEIGLGVIPMGRDVRAFVDALGRLNQDVAAVCDRVVFMAAGLPLTLKAPQ